ncbi:amidohydrolase family protein [Paenibacillus sp.]|uniref:amidohydrolase family protein n=1 Tax=Paenibacillus sp. TaxID=58172 RepID=UPI002D4CEB55|nr:amidohydrolase family protein [Paenibacillus sp.]HZG56181.1 amidohydrolase family protein [Paenibacillus sp.]
MGDDRPERIDAHQHYWRPSRGDYGWLTPETGILYQDYSPSDLAEELRRHGIDRTILVQAAPTVAETEDMLDLYDAHDSIAGVVGWLDFEAEPLSFLSQLDAFRGRSGFVGVRPMIQDLPADWLLREPVRTNVRQLARRGVPLDLQARLWHLPHILELLRALPDLHAVVDHLAKPDIEAGSMSPWAEQLKEIAAFPNVMCKVSGFVSGTPGSPWTREQIRPYLEAAFDVFGPQRTMFGSDWPVCLLSSSYQEVYEAVRSAFPERWGPNEFDAVFGGNAARFYRIRERSRTRP